MKKGRNGFYCLYIKRFLDLTCALLIIFIFWWLYAIVAIIVRLKLGSPVIFKQDRIGKNENSFTMYKFRTMNERKDADGILLPDEKRLTKFGILLRSTSLDELPEVWNVLIGDMSFIGPRPLLVRYLPYYTEYEHHRHDVKPGITGYAQIHGRNYMTWEDKFHMDIDYTENVSLKCDLNIIIQTVLTVLHRDNIDTGSFIEKDGVIYRPLDIERANNQYTPV